ncbi:hypothetical protein ZIOFF_047823 [Zingiber officinale]|uniref:Uncharacterized protein n=1 Tax=Zingiber officinale TaxID=94328 RepID=A0A8J5FTX3_ZINOF|nr:hypothetical protein ZIOFF_047823 [Zingiber officinale]
MSKPLPVSRRAIRAVAKEDQAAATVLAEATKEDEEATLAVPVSPSDLLTMHFQAEGTMDESAIPTVSKALQGSEGTNDASVRVFDLFRISPILELGSDVAFADKSTNGPGRFCCESIRSRPSSNCIRLSEARSVHDLYLENVAELIEPSFRAIGVKMIAISFDSANKSLQLCTITLFIKSYDLLKQ